MKRQIIIGLTLVSVVLLLLAVARANVPAPPVNQLIGIQDGIFNDETEADCRACHDNPGRFPGVMPNISSMDRMHVLAYPPPDGKGDLCTVCHVVTFDPVQMIYVMGVTRNCLASTACHVQIDAQPTVHHATARAKGGDCKACHGTIVSDLGDGHYIPTYSPSIITPYRSAGTGPLSRPAVPPDTGVVQSGACNFCHDSGTDTSTGVSLPIFMNKGTHHLGGFGPPAQPEGSPFCAWCHDFTLPWNAQIRPCENCHGPQTLHNIQASSANPPVAINPGNELPGYGHIGADSDCKGCHGPQALTDYVPYSGPTIVFVSGVSADVIPAGQDVSLTITGVGFINLINGGPVPITVSSKVLLTSFAGTTTLLTPSSIAEDSIVVTIPAATPVGGYMLNVVKVNGLDQALQTSNPKQLIAVTPMTIASATARNGVLTITGSGFGAMPTYNGQPLDLLGVTVNGAYCKVSSWTDTQIVAGCTLKNGDPVMVKTLLNGASATVVVVNTPPVALATVAPSTQKKGMNITFNGTRSYDPDGAVVKWEWQFGDGATKSGSKVTYAYSTKGTYTATLTVTDDKGATGSTTVQVTIR